MQKIIRTNFDRREMRRDRRYALPAIVVTIAQIEYTTLDWSLGGFRLVEGPDMVIGDQADGTLRVATGTEVYPFIAEVVRRDDEPPALAFRFIERSEALVTVLDRAIVGRLMRKRR